MTLVKLYSGREAIDAHHIRAVLDAEGIDAVVMGDHLRLAWAQIPPTLNTQPAVWVKKEDVIRALNVLRGHHSEATELPAWDCSECGETIEGQFYACWQCGGMHPDPETT